MGALDRDGDAGSRLLQVAHGTLLAGAILAMLPVFASFLPLDLGVRPRHEQITMALHFAASVCAAGLAIAFVARPDAVARALAHPMVLAAMFVALWTVLMAPFVDYPWLSLLGASEFGEAAIRYVSLAVFFATAQLLSASERSAPVLFGGLAAVSFAAPIVMFLWGTGFFVSLDLTGYFALPAFLGGWFLSMGRPRWMRIALSCGAMIPALALSSNHSIVVVVLLAGLPGALLVHIVLERRVVDVRLVRSAAVAAVLLAPVAGLVAKWILPDLLDLPSIRSRHLLDIVLYAALRADPVIYAIGQGWGVVPLTVDNFILSADAVMWDGSWDLADRYVTHTHSIYSEALFGAGVPALAGLLGMLAAPLLWVSRERLPIAAFMSVSLAVMGAVSAEFPSTVGAVALAFGAASVRPCSTDPTPVVRMPGRGFGFAMPAIALLLFVGSAFQVFNAYSIRERVADVRANGDASAYACRIHPASSPYLDTDLPLAVVSSYRPVLERVLQGQEVPREDIDLIRAHYCTGEARAAESAASSLHISLETFRGEVALMNLPGPIADSLGHVTIDWPQKMALALNAAPHRVDVPMGFLAYHAQRGNFGIVESLSRALLERDSENVLATWYLGLAQLQSGRPSIRDEGWANLRRALDMGIGRFFPIPNELVEKLKT